LEHDYNVLDINALTVYDNRLIAAGTFSRINGVQASGIAAWDGSTWSPLGSGVNGAVSSLTVYNEKLMVGGIFTTAGNKISAYFAQWTKPAATSVENGPTPPALTLFQNHPNPFNPSTTIRYKVPHASRVTVSVYSPSGQLIRTPIDASVPAGMGEVMWDGKNNEGVPVASGVYFYRLRTGKATLSKKMLLLSKLINERGSTAANLNSEVSTSILTFRTVAVELEIRHLIFNNCNIRVPTVINIINHTIAASVQLMFTGVHL
jgi:hypothetical protein